MTLQSGMTPRSTIRPPRSPTRCSRSMMQTTGTVKQGKVKQSSGVPREVCTLRIHSDQVSSKSDEMTVCGTKFTYITPRLLLGYQISFLKFTSRLLPKNLSVCLFVCPSFCLSVCLSVLGCIFVGFGRNLKNEL